MSKKNDLLNEAIADAKKIKAIALENAKSVLSEHYAPALKQALMAKLSEEMEEDELKVDDLDEKKSDEAPEEEKTPEEELDEKKSDEAPEEETEEKSEEGSEEEEELDLDELLASLDEKSDESPEEEKTPEEELDEKKSDEAPEEVEEVEEEFDFDAFLEDFKREFTEKKTVSEAKKDKKEKDDKKEKEEVKESYETEMKELKTLLNEVNLINAKQLYLNKVLVENDLSDKQKITVLTAFDKAGTVNEAKLVYETLNEGIKAQKSSKNKKSIKENLGLASKSAGSSKKDGKKQINEEAVNVFKDRMQELAGIKRKY